MIEKVFTFKQHERIDYLRLSFELKVRLGSARFDIAERDKNFTVRFNKGQIFISSRNVKS